MSGPALPTPGKIGDGRDVPRYFEFEVTIVLPRRVWRRFLLFKAATFYDLHRAIQDSFGWWDYHLFDFHHPGDPQRVIAGMPDVDDEREVPDAKKVLLKDHFRGGRALMPPQWCEYLYDFGDHWIHEVKLRCELSLPETFKRRLLDGERAAPHEDCGGVGGYERMVAVVETGQDPEDEPVEEILHWLDGWKPERFDLDLVRTEFDRPRSKPTAKRPAATQH